MKTHILITAFIAIVNALNGQEARVREEEVNFTVYPFSEPDPVARPGTIYPYFRFDGYTTVPVEKNIRMVILENSWIKVWITPEIGGKIWGALDKRNNRHFIYYNNVVKFRDIAMRGAWTSGGIEFNFGIIGHAPTTATPVDYFKRINPDGSVSCFLGAFDLPSGTEWRVEVRLPKDKAYFEVISNWNNPTDLSTSLYHWQTAAANASEDLQFYYPGKAYIDHGGNAYPWPVLDDGRNISFYRNNNYNSSHSYHVLGKYTDWFAGYYNNSGYGFGHWSRYPYKPGKKIWIWDLSRAGAIWEDLLTDKNKGNTQYIEMQTGLLFNQEADESTKSPFKHMFFEPGATENFSELWFPLGDLKGVSSISKEGILFLDNNSKGTSIRLQSLGFLSDHLQVTDSTGKMIYDFKLDLEPEQSFETPVDLKTSNMTIKLADGELRYNQAESKRYILDRPLTMDKDFDWGSVYGLYSSGIEKSRERSWKEAAGFFGECLSKDPSYLPALTALAELDIRQLQYDRAEQRLLKVLNFNTYDPEANWLYGTLLERKGELYKARDAFGITLRSPQYRSAALNRLALIALKEKRFEEAWDYISDAGQLNASDRNTGRTAIVTARLRGDPGTWEVLLRRMSNADPLSHFADFERYFSLNDSVSKQRFTSKIACEFASETYIELALWYKNAGLNDEARIIMDLCPPGALADYLSAYLARLSGDTLKCMEYIHRAIAADDKFIFPFRAEYEEILKQADKAEPSWKTKYYLSLLYWSRNRDKEAGILFNECGEQPGSYSFYLARGNFREMNGSDGEQDYLRAARLGAESWRPSHILYSFYVKRNRYAEALDITGKAINLFPGSSLIKYDHAMALLYNGKYDECVTLLQNTVILPHEGEGDGRMVWKFANLLNALKYYSQNDPKTALRFSQNAYRWPENLGVGKPYKVDEREEDYISYLISARLGRKKVAAEHLKKVAGFNEGKPEGGSSINYLTWMALRKLGSNDSAALYLKVWLSQCKSGILASWAKAMSEDNNEEAENVIKQNPPGGKNLPWIPDGTGPDFRIIEEITSLN
jgi:Flp pilus assembly protein TadD